MKTAYITIALILAIGLTSFANQITAVSSGKWSLSQKWNLNRLPQNNDTIIIPAGINITLDYNISLNNVNLIVYGTLILNNGKLNLNAPSMVTLQSGGMITSGGGNNDQIKIGNDFKFRGSEVSLAGPAFASAATGTSPSGFTAMGLLPVKFESFFVNSSGDQVNISWSTSQEVNNSHFEVERSLDGRTWAKIAVVFSAESTSSQTHHYKYSEKKVSASVVYYRVRQVDTNGKFQYSVIKSLRGENGTKTNIFASAKNVTVSFNEEVQESFTVRVVSINGQVIAQQTYNQASYQVSLKVANANSGIYTVQVINQKGWNEAKKVAL